MADKDLTIGFKGEDKGLGSAANKAKSQINEMKTAAGAFASAFTGGIVGGTIGSGIAKGVDIIVGKLRELTDELKEVQRISREMQQSPLTVARIRAEESGRGLPPGTLTTQAARAEDLVNDALAGNSQLVRNFDRLGISLKELQRISGQPFTILDRLRQAARGNVGADQFYALEQILGSREQATQFVRTANINAQRSSLVGGAISGLVGPFGQMFGLDKLLQGEFQRRQDRNFNPPSTFQQQTQDEAEMRALRVRERRLQGVREEMNLRERQSAIERHILQLQEEQAATGSAIRKTQIQGFIETLEDEQRAIRRQRRADMQKQGIGVSLFQTDQLQSVGAYVGGTQSAPIRIMENQLQKLSSIDVNTRATRDAFEQYLA